MKTIFALMLSFFATQSLAVELVPEAVCTGVENGRPITVTSYVNSLKWCGVRDSKSVVIVKNGDESTSVYSAYARELGNKVKHVNTKRGDVMELDLDTVSYPGVGSIVREAAEVKLSCSFAQYELEC